MAEFRSMNERAKTDYVFAYEKAMQDVVQGCGSRAAVNSMVDELHSLYVRTDASLRRLDSSRQPSPMARGEILKSAKAEANRIIERYAPHTSGQFHEMVIAYSFAALLITLPMFSVATLLATATGIAAFGSSALIGVKFLKNWKAASGKDRIASLAHQVSPRHVKSLPRFVKLFKK